MVLFTRRRSKRKESTSKWNVWLCVVSGMVCAAMAVSLELTDPVFYITQMHMHIFEGSEVHQFLTRTMNGVHVSTYMFNITNADSFLAGDDLVLRVQEVGPFTYRETRSNEDMELDPDHGVLRYSPKVTLQFVPEESIARPGDVNVTMLNLPMLGTSSQVSSYPYWTRVAFNMLAKNIKSRPIININAHDYMWGYEDPLLTLGHALIPGMFDFEKIGIMDRFYDSKVNRLEVGATLKDTLMIKKRNGFTKLQMNEHVDPDKCELCDSFEDSYEGILYPAPVTPSSNIRLFKNGLCRLLPMEYHKHTVTSYGADGLIFNLSDSFFSLNGSDNGLLDLSSCYYGLPISLSKTHFLDVDPKVYERVQGLKPDPQKHNSYIIIEPKMAMELETYVQIQQNLVLDDLSHSPEAGPFSNMTIPISYMTIVQPRLEEETIDILKRMYVESPPIIRAMQVIFLVIALTLFTYSALLIFRILNSKQTLFSDDKIENVTVISVQEPLVKNDIAQLVGDK